MSVTSMVKPLPAVSMLASRLIDDRETRIPNALPQQPLERLVTVSVLYEDHLRVGAPSESEHRAEP